MRFLASRLLSVCLLSVLFLYKRSCVCVCVFESLRMPVCLYCEGLARKLQASLPRLRPRAPAPPRARARAPPRRERPPQCAVSPAAARRQRRPACGAADDGARAHLAALCEAVFAAIAAGASCYGRSGGRARPCWGGAAIAANGRRAEAASEQATRLAPRAASDICAPPATPALSGLGPDGVDASMRLGSGQHECRRRRRGIGPDPPALPAHIPPYPTFRSYTTCGEACGTTHGAFAPPQGAPRGVGVRPRPSWPC